MVKEGTRCGAVEKHEVDGCSFYQTYLSHIENGRANPTLNVLKVIVNGFELSVFDLFGRSADSREARQICLHRDQAGRD